MNRSIKKSILITNPSIASDWDVEKNIDLKIENIDTHDKKSVWWICSSGHSYAVSTFTRVRTNGCKYCNKEANKQKQRSARIKKGISTSIGDSPKFLSIWNYDLNKVSPYEITISSNVVISWKCQCGNLWEMSPKSISRRRSEQIKFKCLNCVSKEQSEISLNSRRKNTKLLLKDVLPQLRESWDFEKNDIEFDKVFPVANTKYWWKCHFGHSWSASAQNRNLARSGCPECSGSGTSKIEIYILCELRKIFSTVMWRKKIESFEVDIFIPEYSIGIEVDGEYWHKDKHDQDRKKSNYLRSKGIDMIRIRSDHLTEIEDHLIIVKGKSNTDDFQNITNKVMEYLQTKFGNEKISEYCKNRTQLAVKEYQEMISRLPAPPVGESFLAVYPDVAVEWDYENNAPLTPDLFTPKSDQKFWWICKEKHSWQATIKNRTLRRSNCPDCFDERRSEDSIKRNRDRLGSIGEKYPELVCFWDRQKNAEVDPNHVTAVQTNSYSWICNRLHTFTRQLKVMIKDQSCKHCHSIKETHPELLSEWDYSKNAAVDPIEITQGSDKPLWWVCKNGHSWSSSVVRRIKDNKKCNACSSLGFKFPQLLAEWDFDKNIDLNPMTVHSGTRQKASWRCKQGHQWQTSIQNRTGDKKSNCPVCARKLSAEKTRVTKLVKSGSLEDNFPELANKWSIELNGDLTAKSISSNSHTRVWWKCTCGNIFKQSPNHMTTLFSRGSSYGCEKCS